jgi:hypothetical protein
MPVGSCLATISVPVTLSRRDDRVAFERRPLLDPVDEKATSPILILKPGPLDTLQPNNNPVLGLTEVPYLMRGI